MKKVNLFLIFILSLFSLNVFGQATNCSMADPFCTGTTYSFPMNTGTTSEAGPNYACLCTQPNPVWYYMLIDNPGSITIGISSPTNDVDFTAWGPFTSPTTPCTAQLTANCSGCQTGCPNNTTNPSFYPSGNTVDCSFDAAHAETFHISNALTGQYYLLCITNYTDSPGDLTFSQIAGPGTTNCAIVYCNMTGLSATPGACIAGNTYTVSGSIVFNGAPATGTLTVTNSCGGTQTFNPPFTSPIAYSFSGLPSNGGVCSVTATFTAAPTCTMTTFYTAPPSCNACSVNAGADQSVCGLTATLAATAGQAGYYSYYWDAVGGIIFGNINSATSSITASASGTYTFTWHGTNSSGFPCSDVMTVTFNNPLAGFIYNNNQCLTGNLFNFTNTGTSSGATYWWTFAGGSPANSSAQNPSGITFSTSGPHTVTQLVTVGGCTATYTQTITVYPQPTVNITPTNVTCNGACNGSAIAAGAGGSGTYTGYSWSPGGQTSASISSLCPNTYFVTVTDNLGCTGTNSVIIIQPAPLVLTPSRTDPTCNGACNGTANVVVAGGSGSFSFLWSNLATTQNITGLCANTYTVTVTDNASAGCTQTASVVLNNPSPLVLLSSSVPATCGMSNGSATVSITAGGVPNYNYQWSNGAFTMGTLSTTNTNSSLSAGAITVTVTNGNGCTATTTVNVGSSGAPTATISSSTNPVCFGQCNGTATVSLGGTLNPPYNYIWTTGSSTMGTAAITNSVNNLCNGTSSVTITDILGCSAVASVTVTQPSAVNAITNTVSAHCGAADGSATITANGGTPGYTYLWNAAAGNQNTITAINLLPGTYQATVTDASLCTFVVSATVSNLAGVVASISGTTPVACNGGNNGTATATGTGGTLSYSYQWPVSAGSQTSPTAINLTNGTYVVTVTDATGCTSTASATVNQSTVITATISGFTNALCYGVCNGTANVTAAGGTSPYIYFWTNSQTIPGATGLCAGTYFVTVTDANGCSVITSVTITQPPILTASTTTTSANCGQPNGTATANPTGGTPIYTYLWSGGGQINPIATNLASGSYTVTVTDSKGCTAIANATVGNISGGTASISSTVDVSCSGLCDGSATISMGGGTLPYTYLWLNGTTTPNNPNLCVGTYTGTVTDFVGCTATATATINSPTPLTVSIVTNDVSCFGDCDGILTAAPSGGTSPYSYMWINMFAGAVNNNLCAGSYTVTVTDLHSCTAIANGSISTIPPIVLSAVITSANCGGADGAIDLTVTNGSGPFTYNWLPSGNTQDLNNIIAGVYNVTVADVKGCTQTGSYTVPNISGPTASISSQTNVSCNGLSDGIAQGSVTNGTPTFIYAWSDGQQTQIATGLAAGEYTFSVTDGVGCVSTAIVTITEPNLLTIVSITSTNPLCNGNCNGTATVLATGGMGTLTYQWIGGTPFGGLNPTSSTTTGICSGSLHVLVTDANSCTVASSTSIVEPNFISLSTSSTAETCNGLHDGTATVTPSGGTLPFTYQWDSQSGGQSGSTAVGLAAGTYSVTVTDANYCTEFTTVIVTTPNPIVFSITPTHLTCWMLSNGSIGINVTGGTPNYSFNWTNSQGTYNSTNQNIGNLPAETYFVTVTDQNGCSISTSQIISQPPQLQLNLIKTNETCFQFCNGTINANVMGGQNPYTYLWSNLQGSQLIDSLCPASYTVTVTDFNGCTISSSSTVTGPPLLQLDVDTIINASCGVANGSATIGVQGGSTGYTIIWSAGSPGNALTEIDLPAGNHTVTLIDSMGCTVVQPIAVQNLAGPQITALTPTPVSCAGMHDGVAIVSYSPSSPPAPPYISNWFGYNTGSTFTGDTISNLEGDLYYVTVTDANGCENAGSIIVNEPTLFSSVPYGIANNLCNGNCNGTASVLTGGGTQPYTWNWLGILQTGSSATNLCAGQYTVVATDAHGCTSVDIINITEPAPINITGVVTDVQCNGNSNGIITINPSGGTPVYQANWQPPASGTNYTVANLPAGTFSVVVTDIYNCNATASFTVNQPTPIYVYSSTTPSHCGLSNGTATIDSINGGTPGYIYIWSPGNATTPSISNLTSGNYLINLTDNNGCQVTTNAYVANIAPPTQITFIDTNAVCNGTNTGSATANVVGGLPPYTYLWPDLQFTQTASALAAGIYTVTVTDANGCTIANSTLISQPNPVIIFVSGADSICLNSYAVNISANASGGTLPYYYLWTGIGIVDSSAQTQLVSPPVSTNYYVNVHDANGCFVASQGVVPIYVYPAPSTNISNNATICEGNFYDIQATAAGGSGAPYNYYWSPSGLGNINHVTPITTTTYTLYVTDACGTHSDTVSMTITVLQAPQIIKPPNSKNGCIPLLANFSVIDTVQSGNITYLWNFGDPLSDSLNTDTNSVTSHLYTTSGSFNVTLTLTSSFGCNSTTVYTSLINAYPVPNAEFTYTPAVVDALQGEVQFNAETETTNTVSWTFGDGHNAGNVFTPTNTYDAPGNYTITLFVNTNEGCIDTVQHNLHVNDVFTIWVPTAFYPGTGSADGYFYPKGKGFTKSSYYFAIYDRWGQIIFETTVYPEGTELTPNEVQDKATQNTGWIPGGWNGGYKNDEMKLVKVGTYTWYIRVKDVNGLLHEETGPVTVIR